MKQEQDQNVRQPHNAPSETVAPDVTLGAPVKSHADPGHDHFSGPVDRSATQPPSSDQTIQPDSDQLARIAALFKEEPVAEKIGPFMIRGLLGRGGMGAVYEAEQSHPRRRVALKVIDAAHVTRSALRRFELEADAMARLEHVGIARIYEAGMAGTVDSPQPYFAMELVRGQELTKYANSGGLVVAKRLELLASVCDAVHYAHQCGVIHRDLKPANVVVDSTGQPKILDFGVAYVTDSDGQPDTLLTEGQGLVGTVLYMSPEQARGDLHDLDTRSDIYTLGVMGFELLTGRLPHNVKDKSAAEVLRMIRHDEPARLASIDSAFRGDVDAIIAKAIEKDRDRRYANAADLAADIRRHLEGEPVLARAQTLGYRVSTFTRRHTYRVGALAAVMLIGMVFGSMELLRATAGQQLQTHAALERLENWFYDQRCRYCQPTIPPTNRLEHMDLDEESIAAIGRWPLPRETLALIIDELHNAGAQAIGIDILLADPEQSDGGESDQKLADVMRNAQNVVLPVAFSFGAAGISPRQAELMRILSDDPEMSRERLNGLMVARKLPPATPDEIVTALHQTAAAKIKAAGFPQVPAQQVKRLLLPRQDQFIVKTPASRVLDDELARAEAIKSIHRFGRPTEPGIISPMLCRDEIIPLKQFSDGAVGCGFVNFIVSSDGVTRQVPLWVQDNDRLYPQFGLALACAFLKVKPDEIRIEQDRVIVPRPNGDLSIPVVSQRTSDQPKASLFLDVPFFTSSDWQTSYDYPLHQEPRHHINVAVAWEAIQTRKRIRDSDLELDDAIANLMSLASPEQVKRYLDHRPDLSDFEAREVKVKALLAQPIIRSTIEEYDKESAEEMQRRDTHAQKFMAAASAAVRLPDENRRLAAQLAERAALLRKEVRGKAVLVGSATTAVYGFRTTPLHVQCPSSVVHGMIFNAIITGQIWRRVPGWADLCATAIVGLLVTAAVVWLRPWQALLATVVIEATYLGFNGYVLFGRMQLIAGVARPLVTGASVWAGLTLLVWVSAAGKNTRVVDPTGLGIQRGVDTKAARPAENGHPA